MIFLAMVLVLGFGGGALIGAGIYGPWRRRVLFIWVALPLAAYSGLLILGAFQVPISHWHLTVGLWLMGFGYVGVPMLIFAGGSAVGYLVTRPPTRRWRLKDWRLPQ